MKLEAARRLHSALTEDRSMLLSSVKDLLYVDGIRSEFPDSIPNNLVVYASCEAVLRSLLPKGWSIEEFTKVAGGLYTSGSALILQSLNFDSLKLLDTSPHRVTLWLT